MIYYIVFLGNSRRLIKFLKQLWVFISDAVKFRQNCVNRILAIRVDLYFLRGFQHSSVILCTELKRIKIHYFFAGKPKVETEAEISLKFCIKANESSNWVHCFDFMSKRSSFQPSQLLIINLKFTQKIISCYVTTHWLWRSTAIYLANNHSAHVSALFNWRKK